MALLVVKEKMVQIFYYENHGKFFPIMFPQLFATLSVVFIVEHLHHFILYNQWRHCTSTIGLKFHGIPKKKSYTRTAHPACLITVLALFWFAIQKHCKPKPCKAYRELPVSQFSQGKTCFTYREPCSHCRDPVFL